MVPKYGDGRPFKLDEDHRERSVALLEADQPCTTQEVGHLIVEEFGVTYHPNYIHELLRCFDMYYA